MDADSITGLVQAARDIFGDWLPFVAIIGGAYLISTRYKPAPAPQPLVKGDLDRIDDRIKSHDADLSKLEDRMRVVEGDLNRIVGAMGVKK